VIWEWLGGGWGGGGELLTRNARGDAQGDAYSQLKNPFQKNHALAESLLSRVFSWDVVDVGFPTC
jgi:hypothetical protein